MPAEDKDRNVKKLRDETPVELESQFVLRLPPTPAASLRAAVRSGVMNLRERLSIQLETDMRHGTVRFDKWVMPAKVVDLPCIIESHKTLDRKTFYKTADICQMMICKEEDDGHKTTDEEESPTKKKAALDKKDNKDKKYQWPHGITPPLKNVRKRRFRKTLKKKYVDFPEIEKEVKRLFRMDNEAISVKYEVVNADDEKNEGKMNSLESSNGNMVFVTPGVGGLLNSNSQSLDVAEHDIFGEVVSSSDEDDVNIVDSGDEEGSQMSAVNSDMPTNQEDRLVTEFPKGMLEGSSGGYNLSSAPAANNASSQPSSSQEQESATKAITSSHLSSQNAEDSLDQMLGEHDKSEQENSVLLSRLAELEQEIASIQARRQAQELEVVNIENLALKQRFQNIIDNLKEEEAEKQRQYDDIVSLLNQC